MSKLSHVHFWLGFLQYKEVINVVHYFPIVYSDLGLKWYAYDPVKLLVKHYGWKKVQWFWATFVPLALNTPVYSFLSQFWASRMRWCLLAQGAP